jgi:hypothetical protein
MIEVSAQVRKCAPLCEARQYSSPGPLAAIRKFLATGMCHGRSTIFARHPIAAPIALQSVP